jgi:hypothetical protein
MREGALFWQAWTPGSSRPYRAWMIVSVLTGELSDSAHVIPSSLRFIAMVEVPAG